MRVSDSLHVKLVVQCCSLPLNVPVNWVDVGKTLREQGIDESETVLLRRKFFYSDQNIDSRDPVQLNLLYVQARDAILDGTHPVTQIKGDYLGLLFVLAILLCI